jgi:hypothetical protein
MANYLDQKPDMGQMDAQTRKHNAPILLYVGHKKLFHISLHLYLMLKENSPRTFYYKVFKIFTLNGAFILKVHVYQFWCQLYIRKLMKKINEENCE